MSLPYLSPVHAFGAKGDVHHNMHYIDEHNVVYVAGANLVVYNVDSKTQRFLPLGSFINLHSFVIALLDWFVLVLSS